MEEQELIRKIRQGDSQAFTLLIEESRAQILRHCAHLLKDENLAEDVFQEACIKAIEKISSFKEQASFGTWLWRIAHNLCLDYLRKQRQHPETIFEEQKQQAPEGMDPALLQECLEHLTTQQRRVFELFYIQQLSQKEIAQQLSIPYGTVRSRLYYAKKRLRKFLL